MSEHTAAERVWDDCERSARRVDPSWATRDILIHGIESFAECWDTEFGFHLHGPNDVKELARWLRTHLVAAGRVPESR